MTTDEQPTRVVSWLMEHIALVLAVIFVVGCIVIAWRNGIT